ncbi:hypothetical protein GCM10023238_03540 [Streptomyces heliomycini]
MDKLGVPARPVLPGERGAPVWPDGLAGSMTHCQGYCAAALVRAADLASLGIDAEPHAPLPQGRPVLGGAAAEAARIGGLAEELPAVHWDRLLFSAKESVYKAWFPLTGKWLDFMEADLDLFTDPASAPAAVSGPPFSSPARAWAPGWSITSPPLDHGRGLVATAVAVPHG